MPIKQPKEKKTPAKKIEKKKVAPKAKASEKPQPKAAKKSPNKPNEKKQKPIGLAVMLFEMQMHSVSKDLLTEKQIKLLSKKLKRHRDMTTQHCKKLLDQSRSKREQGIRNLATTFFLKVSKKAKNKIQEAVKKTFQTF